MFRTNWNEIPRLGFIRGTYHFFDCSEDAKAQAHHFSMMIPDIKDYDIAPILDIEQGGLTKGSTAKSVQQQAKTFLSEVEALTGRRPIIYSDYAFFQQYMNDPYFAKYNLWLAEYSGNATPLIPNAWKDKGYLVWQRSDSYSVQSTKSDLDMIAGSLKKIIHQ
jgi:lysozyme